MMCESQEVRRIFFMYLQNESHVDVKGYALSSKRSWVSVEYV